MPNLIETIRLGMQRRRTERALLQLDDRLLRDIGIDRHVVGRASAQRTYML
jgi:uncharacterized protein YjiS (DUF1127 family)